GYGHLHRRPAEGRACVTVDPPGASAVGGTSRVPTTGACRGGKKLLGCVHRIEHTGRAPVEESRGSITAGADGVVRIGDKVIQPSRIARFIDRLLELRASGLSQQEAARALGVDRTVISRLETIGEVRRGPVLALIGFPIANRDELYALARERGVDYVLLMSNRERWSF